MEKLKGIDISEFNGNIDFKKVKDQVDFVYIRATYGRFGIDKRFKEYTEECIENNIPFGFYYYSYATTEELAEDEVKFFLQIINKYKEKSSYPCMIDMEDADSYKLEHRDPSKEVLTKICIKACEKIIEDKMSPIIYASADWFKNRLIEKDLEKYMKWIAWWDTEEDKIEKEKYSIWQYSSKGQISGISSKYVDLNYSFIDFYKIKEYVLNVSKINYIKARTGLQDLSIQFISCYKWGQDLLNKLFDGLKRTDKIEKKEISIKEKAKEIQKYFKLEAKTMNYLTCYIYSDELLQKLYISITNEGINVIVENET